jgi:hypothetical protein
MSGGSRAAVEQVRAQYKLAHDVLEGTMQGMESDHLHWTPDGKGGSIASSYAHVVLGEDVLLHAMYGTPLVMSTHAGSAGVSEPPPQGDWGDWGKRVRVDLDQAGKYAAAVYAATDSFLAGIGDDDLTQEVDMAPYGLGKMTWGALLNLMAVHIGWHTGEISAMKGMQGMQGYPF